MNIHSRVLLTALSALLTFTATAAEPSYYGWRLADLNEVLAKEPRNILHILFDESDGVTPNINVQIQSHTGTMKEYLESSHRDFDRLFDDKNWSAISETQKGESECAVEVVGIMKDRKWHFYARAVKKKTRVYLITATALQSQWKSVGEKMRSYVDSFRD